MMLPMIDLCTHKGGSFYRLFCSNENPPGLLLSALKKAAEDPGGVEVPLIIESINCLSLSLFLRLLFLLKVLGDFY